MQIENGIQLDPKRHRLGLDPKRHRLEVFEIAVGDDDEDEDRTADGDCRRLLVTEEGDDV